MTYYFSKKFLSFYDDSQLMKASMPGDIVPISPTVYFAMKSSILNGKIISLDLTDQPVAVEPLTASTPQLSLQQTITLYSSALSGALNKIAIDWQYDNMTSAATYVNSPIKQFADEAAILVKYRDTAWVNAQNLLSRIQSSTSKVPKSAQAFLDIVLPPTPQRPVQ